MIPTSAGCDGGTVGRNPSKLGATFAWYWLDCKGERIKEDWGLVEPVDLGTQIASNNVAELMAALRLIESLPRGWEGTIYTDSLITLRRITTSHKFNGVPAWMVAWCKDLRRDHRYKVTLLAGHPTRADLKRGFKAKSGYPVSIHNQWADKKCTELSKEFQLRRSLGG
jgi:ribonuclease HI